MSTDPRPSPPAPATAPGAYGLAIESDAGLAGIEAASGACGGRRADHRLVGTELLERRLTAALSEIGRDGEGRRRVEYHRHEGDVLVRTASFGQHLIADRGRTVLSAVEAAEPRLWRRYVLGQVLPLAASIQGLEIFHAGAVATAAGVIALAGPSGAGKSSITAAIVAAGGGRFYADDVLAVELRDGGLIAFPGTATIAVPHQQAALAGPRLSGPRWDQDERKALLRIDGERRPLPVAGFVRLVPDRDAEQPRFAPCPADRLMATTYDGLSADPGRLLRLLAASAALAGGAAELRYRPGSDPRSVAAALLARLEQASPVGVDGA